MSGVCSTIPRRKAEGMDRSNQLPLRADGGQHLTRINPCRPMSHRADPYRVSAGQPRYMRLRFPAAPPEKAGQGPKALASFSFPINITWHRWYAARLGSAKISIVRARKLSGRRDPRSWRRQRSRLRQLPCGSCNLTPNRNCRSSVRLRRRTTEIAEPSEASKTAHRLARTPFPGPSARIRGVLSPGRESLRIGEIRGQIGHATERVGGSDARRRSRCRPHRRMQPRASPIPSEYRRPRRSPGRSFRERTARDRPSTVPPSSRRYPSRRSRVCRARSPRGANQSPLRRR
jgi:hypothetical protein